MRYPFLNSDPTAEVTVTVTDGANPLEGAVVTFTDYNDTGVTFTGTTNASGQTVIEVPLEKYDVTATCTGYVDYEHPSQVTVSGDTTLSIAMESATQTGTVTVTALSDTGGGAYPVSDGMVALATEQIDWANPDPTKLVAIAQTFDETGTGTLATMEQSTDIPFGTYYLCAMCSEDSTYYSGTLTVDGDETVTITLTPIDNIDNG